MTDPDAAYISCGTWGLVGVELDRPVVTEEARAANFTNEGGVDGRVRFLTNVMGTWLLSETLRTWGTARGPSLSTLLDLAAAYQGPEVVFDVQDPRFTAPNESGPGDMPARIADWCREHDVRPPDGRVALVRSIVASLAAGFATAVERAAALSGRDVRRVHVVGGGAQNALLCRLLADRLGLPVLAGPVEATALGNVLVQARAHGALSGSLEDLRALVARTQPIVVHQPHWSRTMKRQMPKAHDLAPAAASSRSRCCRPRERRLAKALTIEDLRRVAKRRTPKAAFDYTDGAADGEVSLARAREAFADVEFHPAILRDVSTVDT